MSGMSSDEAVTVRDDLRHQIAHIMHAAVEAKRVYTEESIAGNDFDGGLRELGRVNWWKIGFTLRVTLGNWNLRQLQVGSGTKMRCWFGLGTNATIHETPI